ncbi:MAG: heavy metal translocating P-type ATPase, partial [Spirochaetales bacterium]|nr:heavy metal translocating P-type ATPase [Spirochaetales bacterium]
GWMALTGLGVVGPGGLDVSASLSAAIATLVIACPCALGLATPTALAVGMGYGAERGVLVRNGEAIQNARGLDTIVFDKTGTLTVGRPEVSEVYFSQPSPVRSPAEIDTDIRGAAARLTRAVERRSEHPLARAIVAYLDERMDDTAPCEVSQTEAIPGWGILATVDGQQVRVGSLRWLYGAGVVLSDKEAELVEAWKGDGMTVVGTAIDGSLAALFGLADVIKPDSLSAIERLHALGLRTAMLTGDNEAAARTVAEGAGIGEVFAELLPDKKIEVVRSLQREGRAVAMVGDGINDAPALTQANVGIAVGTGTDIAIESADVTLMSSSLLMIPRAVEISRHTFAKIRTNLFWAFFYNLVAIPLAVTGLLHPIIAEIAMAFSSVTVVSNSLHLRRVLRRREA